MASAAFGWGAEGKVLALGARPRRGYRSQAQVEGEEYLLRA